MLCPNCGQRLVVADSLVYGHAIDGVYVSLYAGKCEKCSRSYQWVNENPQSIREVKHKI